MTRQSRDSNGLLLSNVGKTAYKNVSVGSNYLTNNEEMYISFVALTKQEQIDMNISSFMIHLGYFEDARDAAYTSEYFISNRNKEFEVLKKCGQGKYYIECPKWEFPAVDKSYTASQKTNKISTTRRFIVSEDMIKESLRTAFISQNKKCLPKNAPLYISLVKKATINCLDDLAKTSNAVVADIKQTVK